MNCQFCQEKLDAYFEGILPESMKVKIEDHLDVCPSCSEALRLLKLAGRVFDEEKSLESNPFLKTRIMASIEQQQAAVQAGFQPDIFFRRAVRPFVIGLSVAAASVFGIVAGNTIKPAGSENIIPVELAYINDEAIESVNFFLND